MSMYEEKVDRELLRRSGLRVPNARAGHAGGIPEHFVEHWVDTAMCLDDNDLNHMRYLIRSQQSRGW